MRKLRLPAAALAIALLVTAAQAASSQITLAPGDSIQINCSTELTGSIGTNSATLACAATPTPTPSPTASPSPTPAPSSLTLPVRAAFYYPWFPESWNQQGYNPFTRYHPTLGFYDSSDSAVIQSHVASMQGAGIQAGIASWWGQGTPTDGRIDALLANAGPQFKWTLYYEPEGAGNPTATAISADLDYISSHYASNPAFAHVNGKPVLFVYGGAETCGMADRWKAANLGRFYLVLKVFSGYTNCANQPDSWHQYAPAVAVDRQAGYSYSISPGFWRPDESAARLTRDLNRFKANVASMVASHEPWQLITTFNEWGEGTSIEPASEWGNAYLDALGGAPSPTPSPTPSSATSLPSPTASSTVPPSPSPTAQPTSVPTPTPTVSPTSTPVAGGTIQHVIVVWLENHEATAVTASSMPYLFGLGQTYGTASQFYAIRHPSLPNYLAFWSGSTQGVTDDGTYNLAGASISNQMDAAGKSWRTYAQNYPATGCNKNAGYSGGVDGWGVAGSYARKHNPAMSFTYVSGSTTNCANIQPLANFNPLVNYAFVVPNLCNDAHDCSLGQADSFLRAFLPSVFNSSDWAHTLLVVSFDEGSSSTNGGGRIYTMLARQGLSGFTSATQHNHYGLLRTIENVFGLPCLGSSCSATPLTEFLP